jgi:small subunit ribosomal protein S5
MIGTTVPHDVIGHFGAGRVLLRPAAPGTGVIAGGAVRAVVESAGIHDILSKCLGTTNKHNVVNATIAALQMLRAPEVVAGAREKPTDEVAVDYPVAAMASHAGEASSIVSGTITNPSGAAS